MNAWAENMKAARKRAGLSRAKLSEMSGVSEEALKEWETIRGRRLPSLALLVAVTDTLGITIDEYINGK